MDPGVTQLILVLGGSTVMFHCVEFATTVYPKKMHISFLIEPSVHKGTDLLNNGNSIQCILKDLNKMILQSVVYLWYNSDI